MTIKRRLTFLTLPVAVTALLVSGAAFAADADTIFESCTDSNGQALVAEADTALPELVRVISDSGQASIHYNPDLFPRLSPNARIFLYMDQCARHGIDAGRKMTVARARLADCMAINTLLADKVVTSEDLPALQDELVFSDPEWQQLPGPSRKFDFMKCPQSSNSGNTLRIPLDTPPTVKQTDWNSCVRACADKLWACQKKCRGNACGCLDTYYQCKEPCGPADKPAVNVRTDTSTSPDTNTGADTNTDTDKSAD